MTSLSRELTEYLGALPSTHRAELLAQIERDSEGISRIRLRRIADILDRHRFGGQTPEELCREMGISRRQFYRDLREGERRAAVLLGRGKDRTRAIVVENPRQSIIAQARAVHQAGMSQRALNMLSGLHSAPLHPNEAVAVAGLELEVRESLAMPFDSLLNAVGLIERARAYAGQGDVADEDRALLDGTAHWLQTYLSYYGPDPVRFTREYEGMTSLLRPRAFAGNRDAAIAFCNFTLSALQMFNRFDVDTTRAERALSDVDDLLRLRKDVPPSLVAMLHVRYASFFYGKTAQTTRFRQERSLAYKLGVEGSSTPSVWFALGMEVPHSIVLGETTHALACASGLYSSVLASESVEWQFPAKAMLAHTYNALGKFAESEQLLPMRETFAQPHDPHLTVAVCETLLGLRRYEECANLATRFMDSVAGTWRAWALIFRAEAAHYRGDRKNAVADISDAIATFESAHWHSFYAVCSGYRAAHSITQEKRYHDVLHVIHTILEDDVTETPLVSNERDLTARQREIARLAVAGETNGAIARQLKISPRTVKNSFNAIYARLGIRSRAQLEDALEGNARPH
jgi:DNA-binding CsgD family transcriptional regulator